MFTFQVDAMLQKLEKEIDDVDAQIGDRWRLLDRSFSRPFSVFLATVKFFDSY